MADDIAVLKGRTVMYSYLEDARVLLMKSNYQHHVASLDTFNHLYARLSNSVAALRTDCIQYAVYYPYKPLYAYPQWYIQAHHDGDIYGEDFDSGTTFLMDLNSFSYDRFYEPSGELLMTPGDVIVRNGNHELRYMYRDDFLTYYEVPGGLDNED